MSQGYTLVRGLDTSTWREHKATVDPKSARPAEHPSRRSGPKRPNLLQVLAEGYCAALLRTFENRS